jgi:nicotinate phosphoribosyltransferase
MNDTLLPEGSESPGTNSAARHAGQFCPGDALLIEDLQNDFLPGGALAVPHSDEVVPCLNRYVAEFARRSLPIFASRDWHPKNHSSFHAQGGPWPEHCVMHTSGAAFPSALELPPAAIIISKASEPAYEAYSSFTDTDLEQQLHARGVKRLYVGGLATDYCVLHTVRDALRLGFAVFLLRDATRAINLENDDGQKAEAEMFELGAAPFELGVPERWRPESNALLTDLYQLTMLRGYFNAGMQETAVFEFFVRRLPAGWNFLVAAGLEQLLDFLEDVRFAPADLEWLERTGEFDARTIEELGKLRFTGEVHAMPEGTIFFPDEPVVRVTAPLPQAQLVETRLVNLLQFQTVIASKAVRSVLAAPGKSLIDFGLRRAHGFEAGLLAARACYLAGFAGSSNVLARQRFGIPWSGTMAHSFVEACDSEEEAFLRFARTNPRHVVLLIDTYDTEAAAAKVVRIAPLLKAEGIAVRGVRLDSGDLATHAQRVREILDKGGLRDVTIFASGNLDEHQLHALSAAGAPIDGFGVGSRITTSADAPYLDCAYKLQAYAGEPRCKHSEGKATWPGAKQVFRRFDHEGRMESDTVALAEESGVGQPLLECVMRAGRRVAPPTPLPVLPQRLKQHLRTLPVALQGIAAADNFPVTKSRPLHELALRLGAVSVTGTTGPRTTLASSHRHGLLSRISTDGSPLDGMELAVQGDTTNETI